MALEQDHLNALARSPSRLAHLLAYLRSIQYSLPEVARLVGERDPLNLMKNGAFCALAYGENLRRNGSPLACMAQLFMLGGRLDARTYGALPDELRSVLEEARLVARLADDSVCGEVTIGEFDSTMFLSDKLFESDGTNIGVQTQDDVVWPMSEWSLSLYRRLEKNPRWTSFLDVGGGTGCLSILAQERYPHTVGIDLNPRATAFSELNATLNNAKNTRYVTADCFAFTDPEVPRFDHVVFAAPSGPSGDSGGTAMVSHGGRLGHELLLRFLHERIDDLLAPLGLCQVYAVFAVEERYGSIQSLVEHALPANKFDVSVDALRSGGLYISREHLRTNKLPPGCHFVPTSQGGAFLDSLRQAGIIEVASAVVNLSYRAAGSSSRSDDAWSDL